MKQRFKNLLERNQWIKGIPNSLTLSIYSNDILKICKKHHLLDELEK